MSTHCFEIGDLVRVIGEDTTDGLGWHPAGYTAIITSDQTPHGGYRLRPLKAEFREDAYEGQWYVHPVDLEPVHQGPINPSELL